jgi:5-methylcytosine-specific restriction endonuclease McrA
MIKATCSYCNEEFYVSQSEVNRGNGKFCSRSCSAKFRNSKKIPESMELTCNQCGRKYTRRKSYIAKLIKRGQQAKYCSLDCNNKAKTKEREKSECLFCGQPFFVTRNRKFFCSQQCWWSYKSENSKETSRFIKLGLRFRVLSRDNFTCQYCGNSPRKDDTVTLHLDHIIPFSQGGKTTFDNLITSCQECNLGKGVNGAEGI